MVSMASRSRSNSQSNGSGRSEERLTIDQLAQRTGMTVRNIRAHQSRGLLPPPEVEARTGYYDSEHVARIKLIQEMQAEGFNLKAIERLIEGSSGAVEEALGFKRAALTPFGDEQPEYITQAELEERFGGPFEDKVARKAVKLGLIRPLDEDRWEVPSPTLFAAGEELVRQGVPIDHVLAVAERVLRHSAAVADAFVRVFVDDILGPLPQEGAADPSEWARKRDALLRLRPLASEALMAAFKQRMTEAAERRFSKALDR
jgi:DNA-binding transcriptional MerR regulator